MAKQFIILPGEWHEGTQQPVASFDKLEEATAWIKSTVKKRKVTHPDYFNVFDTDSLKLVYQLAHNDIDGYDRNY